MAVLFGLCSLNLAAQEKKSFSLEDLNFGGTNYRNMIPKTRNYYWRGNELMRLDGEKCYRVDKETGTEKLWSYKASGMTIVSDVVLDTAMVEQINWRKSLEKRLFVKDNNLHIIENQVDTIVPS